MISKYYFIIIYLIYSQDSFRNLDNWLREIKNQSSPDIKVFVIGNKSDLENERKISTDQGEQFKNENKLDLFMESSAKTGFNAKNVFIEAAKTLYLEHLKYKDRASRPGSISSLKGGIKLPRPPQPEFSNDLSNIDTNDGGKKGGCCK